MTIMIDNFHPEQMCSQQQQLAGASDFLVTMNSLKCKNVSFFYFFDCLTKSAMLCCAAAAVVVLNLININKVHIWNI